MSISEHGAPAEQEQGGLAPKHFSPLAAKANLESSAGSVSKNLHWAFDLQACKDTFAFCKAVADCRFLLLLFFW